MKTIILLGILLFSTSGQAISMGHPHNLFVARKQMRKAMLTVTKPKTEPLKYFSWEPSGYFSKTAFSERLVAALAQMRLTQAD